MFRMVGSLAAFLSIVLVSGRPASAQSDASDRLGTALLRALYVATPIVQTVDGVSTMRVIHLGGREQNPLMAPVVSSPAVFALTKAAIAFGEISAAHSMAKRHKFLAIGTLAGLNVAYALFAVHNFHVANRLQTQAAGRP